MCCPSPTFTTCDHSRAPRHPASEDEDGFQASHTCTALPDSPPDSAPSWAQA